MSGAVLLLQSLVTVDIGSHLGLHALTVRACMLALAWSFAAVAAFRWAGVIYAELHRFIILSRQTVMLALCTLCTRNACVQAHLHPFWSHMEACKM